MRALLFFLALVPGGVGVPLIEPGRSEEAMLQMAQCVTVSPDGKNVYATGQDSIKYWMRHEGAGNLDSIKEIVDPQVMMVVSRFSLHPHLSIHMLPRSLFYLR